MKRLSGIITLLAMLFMLTGCPFEAPFPLSAADEAYPAYLKGLWITEGAADQENPEYYELIDVDGRSFTIREYYYQAEEDAYSQIEYTAHITSIGDDRFLNIYDPEVQLFTFYNISLLENGTIRLLPVTENITETFGNSEEMRVYFKKYKGLSFFYEEAEIMLPYSLPQLPVP